MNCSGIDHLSINVVDLKRSDKFYDQFLNYLGFKRVGKDSGWSNGPTAIWLNQVDGGYSNKSYNRKNTGLNHLAFRAGSKEEIDQFYKNFLLSHAIPILYGGPREYPQYRDGYYAVYFEDPDRIKLEFMWFPE